MKSKKIVFLISSEIFYRNYISTGLVDLIQKQYNDLEILIPDDIQKPEKAKFKTYSISQQHENRHFQYLKILSWRYRKLSRTFKFRFLRTSQFKFIHLGDLRNLKKVKNTIWRNFVSIKRRAKILLLANSIIFPISKSFFEFILKPDHAVSSYLKNVRPDVVIMPSSAYDPIVMDIIHICQEESIKTVLLVDNWDNVSSKSILWRRPDVVGVWGEQTKEHAVEIQGLSNDQVSCIGTPRFEQYFEKRDLKSDSHFNFRYILFVGQSLPSDERRIVQLINDILSCSPFRESGIKLIYRPHPWAMNQNITSVEALEAVVIDPQISAKKLDLDRVEKFQPSLDYYPSLLQNAEFVVSALTSMLIEASIFRKRVIAIAHNEPNNYTSPHRVLSEYKHFEGIEKLPNVTISHNEADFTDQFKYLLGDVDPVDKQLVDIHLKRFLNYEGTYSERLLKLLAEKI